jgi:hypothetical protein
MGEALGTTPMRRNLVGWENHLQRIGGTTGAAAIAVMAASAILVGGCGSSSDTPSHLKLSVSESGKKASFTTPKSAEGGLVEVDLSNQGKAPHGVQFVRYTGNHTAEEALKEVSGESEETPDWLRAQGGIGAVQGGKSDTATLNLPEGNYVLIDAAAFSGGEGPPATAEMKINSGSEGSLPDTPATVVADETGKDKYAWDISGLKAGENQITFESKGDEALHLIIAVPVKGKAPPLSTIKKDLGKEGPPPSYVDFEAAQSTAILDGGLSQTTTLDLEKPGEYIFFCPLQDRDGGKSHDQEGLLKVETVH